MLPYGSRTFRIRLQWNQNKNSWHHTSVKSLEEIKISTKNYIEYCSVGDIQEWIAFTVIQNVIQFEQNMWQYNFCSCMSDMAVKIRIIQFDIFLEAAHMGSE